MKINRKSLKFLNIIFFILKFNKILIWLMSRDLYYKIDKITRKNGSKHENVEY